MDLLLCLFMVLTSNGLASSSNSSSINLSSIYTILQLKVTSTVSPTMTNSLNSKSVSLIVTTAFTSSISSSSILPTIDSSETSFSRSSPSMQTGTRSKAGNSLNETKFMSKNTNSLISTKATPSALTMLDETISPVTTISTRKVTVSQGMGRHNATMSRQATNASTLINKATSSSAVMPAILTTKPTRSIMVSTTISRTTTISMKNTTVNLNVTANATTPTKSNITKSSLTVTTTMKINTMTNTTTLTMPNVSTPLPTHSLTMTATITTLVQATGSSSSMSLSSVNDTASSTSSFKLSTTNASKTLSPHSLQSPSISMIISPATTILKKNTTMNSTVKENATTMSNIIKPSLMVTTTTTILKKNTTMNSTVKENATTTMSNIIKPSLMVTTTTTILKKHTTMNSTVTVNATTTSDITKPSLMVTIFMKTTTMINTIHTLTSSFILSTTNARETSSSHSSHITTMSKVMTKSSGLSGTDTATATNSSIFAKATSSSAVKKTVSLATTITVFTRVKTSPVSTSTAYSSRSLLTTPPYPKTFHLRITINEACPPTYESEEFKEAVRKSCNNVLKIGESDITVRGIKCGSILVDMEIKNVKNENITQKLENAIKNNQLKFTYEKLEYTVTSVKEIPPSTNNEDGDDDNTAFIIYIVFGAVLGLAFLIGITALIVRCRHERSTGMFHLPSEENLELSGFSDRNKSYRSGNFYGELQPESSEHRISGIPNESELMTNDVADNTDNGGTFGGGYLPAWKNLPTVDMSEVAHEDGANEADEKLVTYGKAGGEEGTDSGRTDVASYENVGAV